MTVSRDEFAALQEDHNRLRVVSTGLIMIVGALLERAGADAATVKEWKAAFPQVGFNPDTFLNAGLKILNNLPPPKL